MKKKIGDWKLHFKLIDEVIEQIRKDISEDDFTAIAELLLTSPNEKLIGYLPENDQSKYNKINPEKK